MNEQSQQVKEREGLSLCQYLCVNKIWHWSDGGGKSTDSFVNTHSTVFLLRTALRLVDEIQTQLYLRAIQRRNPMYRQGS